jgi:serine/threonine protein kinase
MGAVYHARQLSLDRSVAIKVLPPELARNRNFIQRFEREAKSLARINHANILQIYDFGEDQALGIYFMVIEYVDGWDLGEVMRRQPTLSQIETLDILRQALLGLEQAAEKGVIHRDIKPDNLMVGTTGLCKVSDFGLAKGSSGGSEVTSVGVRVGTPAFMSPEQCDGVDVDSRSDVYNLGCTAYLMLTGRLPFDGDESRYPDALLVIHIDQEHLLPTACYSYADGERSRLLGSYVYTDLRINTGLGDSDFDPDLIDF